MKLLVTTIHSAESVGERAQSRALTIYSKKRYMSYQSHTAMVHNKFSDSSSSSHPPLLHNHHRGPTFPFPTHIPPKHSLARDPRACTVRALEVEWRSHPHHEWTTRAARLSSSESPWWDPDWPNQRRFVVRRIESLTCDWRCASPSSFSA